MENESGPDDFNVRILGKIAKSRLTRYEAASIPYEIVLRSPEMKHRLAREFDGMQGNLYIMRALGRLQFPAEVLDEVTQALWQQIADRTDEVAQEIAAVQAQLDSHGITHLAIYADAPITVTARVRFSHARKYLQLMEKTDQLLQMLETLAGANLTSRKLLNERKAHFNRAVKQIAQTVRAWKMEREQVRSAQDHANWPSGLR